MFITPFDYITCTHYINNNKKKGHVRKQSNYFVNLNKWKDNTNTWKIN